MRSSKSLILFVVVLLMVSCSKKDSDTNINPPPPPPPPPPTPTSLINWWKASQTSYPGYIVSPYIYFGSDGFHYEHVGSLGNLVGTWSYGTNDSIKLNFTAGFGAPSNSTVKIKSLGNNILEITLGTFYASYVKLDSPMIDSKPISSIAGTGVNGFTGDGGPATAAQIQGGPFCIDASNNIYLLAGNRIRKISAATGIITTIAGTGVAGNTGNGGPAINAQIEGWSVAIDANSNLYVGDYTHNCIRKINATDGIINMIAGTGNTVAGFSGDGGPAINAQLGQPESLCFDATGNLYFINSTSGSIRIRKIAAGTGIITTIAGNGVYGVGGDGGPALSAQISADAIAIDNAGNIYLGGQNFYRIRKITASTGIINTIAGTGVKGYNGEGVPALSAQINDDVSSLYVDAAGNIYFAESRNPRVRKIATDGKVYTVAGTGYTGNAGDGPHATAYDLGSPASLGLDSQGNILFTANLRIRKVNGN